MPKLKSKTLTAAQLKVPYAAGFKPVSKLRQLNAIKGENGSSPISSTFQAGDDFNAVPAPVSDLDWLAQFAEEGQTYKQFLRECPWLSTRKLKYMKQSFHPDGATIQDKYPEGTIYILPLGTFDSDSGITMDTLVEYARLFFCLPVGVLPPVELTFENNKALWLDGAGYQKKIKAYRQSSRIKKHCLNVRIDAKTGRRQLAVDTLLMTLKQHIPDNALCVIALTMEDLYETPSDLFVAGMAAGNHRVAVFSFFRYEPGITFSEKNWYEMAKQTNSVAPSERKKLLLLRSCKLLVHEVSHLLGIDHCIFYDCCMNGSGNLEEDFRQPMQLCPVDLRKLQVLCGFDVVKRYEGLLKFFNNYHLVEEANWVKRRLDFILS